MMGGWGVPVVSTHVLVVQSVLHVHTSSAVYCSGPVLKYTDEVNEALNHYSLHTRTYACSTGTLHVCTTNQVQ